MSERERIEVELHDSPVSGVRDRVVVLARQRWSIAQVLESCGVPVDRVRVVLDGCEVPREWWPRLRPHGGSRLTVVRVPADPATLTAIGAFFAAAGSAFTSVVTFGAFGTATVGAGASAAVVAGAAVGQLVGTAVVAYGIQSLAGALTNPPKPDQLRNDAGPASPTFQGKGNPIRPRAPFPYVAGDFRFQPPAGAFPYTFVRGGESVFVALFILGRGEIAVDPDDVLVGDIPFTSFDRGELAIRDGSPSAGPLTLYTNRVFQSPINHVFEPIPFDDETLISPFALVRIAGSGHQRIGVDFSLPGGISRVSSQSARGQVYLFGMQVQFRKNGGAWQEAPLESSFTRSTSDTSETTTFNGQTILKYRGARVRPLQLGYEWDVDGAPGDVFDVQVRRLEVQGRGALQGGGSGKVQLSGTVVWFAAKGFNFDEPPLLADGVATLEMRIPLDSQFAGIENNLSVRARRRVRIYDPAAVGGADADGWSLQKFESSNNAAILRDMLQGENNRIPELNFRLDIPSFTAFYEYCRTFDDGGSGPLRFDWVFENRDSIFECGKTVAAAGRARLRRDGQNRFTIPFDGPKSTPRGIIQAANSRNFKIELSVPREVHAIRALFVDRTSGFDIDGQQIVFADGYSEDGANGTKVADEATFITQEFPGTTVPELVHALARFYLANLLLRRRSIEHELSVEHLHYSSGDLVLASHPAALIGEAWTRVRSASAVAYRDPLDRERADYAEYVKVLTAGTGTFGDLSGPVAYGEGALQLTASSASAVRVTQTFPTPLDCTGLRVDVRALVGVLTNLSSTDGVRIRVSGPTAVHFKEWRFGSSAGLNASTLTNLGAVLSSTPDASGGMYEVAQTTQWELQANVVGAQVGARFRFNDLRFSRVDGAVAEVELVQRVPLRVGVTYAVDHRRLPPNTTSNVMVRLALRRLSDFGVTSDRTSHRVYLTAPISDGTQPIADELVAYGEASNVTQRFIVKEKVTGPNWTARTVLVDEAPGVHSAVAQMPTFSPSTTLPVPLQQAGPAQPVIRALVADERALVRAGDGTLRPRILLQLIPGTDLGRPAADFFSVRYRRTGESGLHFLSVPRVDATTPEVVIDDVDQGATYEVVAQAVSRAGLVSASVRQEVEVTGSSNLPPDVESFRIEGLFLRWELPDAPLDLAGFRVTRAAVGGTYSSSRSVHAEPLVSGNSFLTSGLDPGNATLFIVAVDVVGNESANPATLTAFVGNVPIQNVVNTIDVAGGGFVIVDQVDRILSGFEDLIPKEVADDQQETDSEQIGTLQGLSGSRVISSQIVPQAGIQSLRVTLV